jgi:predicted metal-binding membrane protein
MSGARGIERLRADRTVVLALLGLLAALCWAYLLFRVGRLAPVGTGTAVHAAPYRAPELALLLALWVAVIAAVMLPAAAPSVLLYARVRRERRERWVYPCALALLLGELFVWCCCALAAALTGWLLHDAGALDDTMAISHPTVGALMLVAAGVYQWTPAKHACLDNGRDPLAFVLTAWRRGLWGAFRMGVTDARYGTGCCWLLLALVLPAGVLNLPVIGGLIAVILAEKQLPGGHVLACATGLGLVAWGTALLFP